MEKKEFIYKLKLEGLTDAKGLPLNENPIEFSFGNHDNLFRIIELSKQKNLFETETESIQFTLGLKLLTEIMLKNKSNSLFEELTPAIGGFMKKLKSM